LSNPKTHYPVEAASNPETRRSTYELAFKAEYNTRISFFKHFTILPTCNKPLSGYPKAREQESHRNNCTISFNQNSRFSNDVNAVQHEYAEAPHAVTNSSDEAVAIDHDGLGPLYSEAVA
jgi:hypothetical protein